MKSKIVDLLIGFVGAATLMLLFRFFGSDPTGHFGLTVYNQFLRLPLLILFLVGIIYFWKKRRYLAVGILLIALLLVYEFVQPFIFPSPVDENPHEDILIL